MPLLVTLLHPLGRLVDALDVVEDVLLRQVQTLTRSPLVDRRFECQLVLLLLVLVVHSGLVVSHLRLIGLKELLESISFGPGKSS